MPRAPGIQVAGRCRTCRAEIRTVSEAGRVQAKVPCPKDPAHPEVVCRREKTTAGAASAPAADQGAGAAPDDPDVIDVPRYRRSNDEPGPGDPGHADPAGQRAGGDTGDTAGDVGSPTARVPADGAARRRFGFAGRRSDRRRDDHDDPDDFALAW